MKDYAHAIRALGVVGWWRDALAVLRSQTEGKRQAAHSNHSTTDEESLGGFETCVRSIEMSQMDSNGGALCSIPGQNGVKSKEDTPMSPAEVEILQELGIGDLKILEMHEFELLDPMNLPHLCAATM